VVYDGTVFKNLAHGPSIGQAYTGSLGANVRSCFQRN